MRPFGVRPWLIPILTAGIFVAAWAGIASERVPSLSPWPMLSFLYMLTGMDMAEPMPRWPLMLGYSGAFLIWVLMVSVPPMRIGLYYLSVIAVLTVANIGWIGAFGARDLTTLIALLAGVLIPLVLLIVGHKLRGRENPNRVLVHGGLFFAWIAYGAFPVLSGAFD